MQRKIKNYLTFIYKILFRLLGEILPKDKKLIVFESFLGKQYSDNPRAIFEYLQEHYPAYKMYWSVERKSLDKFSHLDLNYVRRFSLKWLILMTRSKYWVTNSRLPIWIPKPGKTIYLQTWHGTPLKRLAMDMEEVHMPGTNTDSYKENFTNEAKKWDYLISPNAYSTEIFKRAFQFEQKLLETGYPRNDILFNKKSQEDILALKKKLNIPLDKKIILYAPTWRDNQFYNRGHYKFDLQMNLELLEKTLGEHYIIIMRLHYLVAEKLDFSEYKNFIIDYSTYPDIRDLYLISDMLITDYSSVFFDYANLKRPMIFYMYDIEEYRDKLRGFYLDIEKEAPGPIVKTTEEIIQEIKKIEQNNFNPSDNHEVFFEKFCYLEDGQASKRVVEQVFKNSK